MKTNKPRTLLLAIAAGTFVTGHSLTGSIIYEENFNDLTPGELDGQADFIQVGDSLSVIDQGDGDLAIGGPASTGAWFNYAVPLGTTINSGWVWTTYTLERNSSDTARGAVLALNNTSSTGPGNWGSQNVQYSASSNTWQIRPGGDFDNSVTTGISISAPDTIIGGVNLDTGIAYLWVNPDETDFFELPDGGTADITLTNSKLEGPFDHLIFNGRNAEASPVYDDIIVATTSEEVGLTTLTSAINITSLTSLSDGVWEVSLEGVSNTGYELYSSTTLDFASGSLVENLSQDNLSEPGTITGTNDSIIVTNDSGIASAQITLPGNPSEFIRAQEAEVPALFEENFDLTDTLPVGWTSNGPSNGTDWEVGAPSGANSAPRAAISEPYCVGTNIDGYYTENANVTLTSPSFSVPLGQDIVLSYQQYIDTDTLDAIDDDSGAIRILDADSAEVLFSAAGIEGATAAWSSETFTISGVSDRNVQIEFNFTSNAGAQTNMDVYAGFYIDDIVVNVVDASQNP